MNRVLVTLVSLDDLDISHIIRSVFWGFPEVV